MGKINLGNNKVLVVKKSLAGQSVQKSIPSCGDAEFEKYVKVMGYRTEPSDADIVKFIVPNTGWMKHLIDEGYIAVESDELRFFKGGRFVVNIPSGKKELVLVAITDPKKGKAYVVWSLVNPLTGNPWDSSYCTVDKPFLTVKELEAITGVKQPVGNFVKGYKGKK